MKKQKQEYYDVTIMVRLLANDEIEAAEIGQNIGEHVMDTFNDDDSIKGFRVDRVD